VLLGVADGDDDASAEQAVARGRTSRRV